MLEALRDGLATEVLVAKGVEEKFVRELKDLAVRVRWVSRIELDQLVGTTQHQGIVAEVSEPRWSHADDIVEAGGDNLLLVLLDGITDPRNFGAILRSAEVLGADGVIVEERRSAPLSAVVAKTAAGATQHLPVAQVKNLPRFIASLKERGVWVYGAAGEASQDVRQTDFSGKVALVIGAEGEGMRRLVREQCDVLVSIPVRGKIQSLNASVAAGILLHEATRHR